MTAKNIEGRPDFLQQMQDFGVNLICVEDGIDSSQDSGKLMISVLSAVAEIERENILVQTMEGRRQKAREGRWNGGFAPYGYALENGELVIDESEAEVIRVIFDKYIHTTMGIAKIANWLNANGYQKKKRQNNTLDMFSAPFVKGVLDNPVYAGKLAYGRRHNEKIQGSRNEYHIVKQDDYMLHDGVHEAIISEADWLMEREKRAIIGVRQKKTHSLDHEHILSGIVCCPVCGSGMNGNVNRKRKKDGTQYKDYFYYQCKHRKNVDGHRCDYDKQWGQEIIDDAVEAVIRKLVQNPTFAEAIKQKIGARIDTSELEQELEAYRKRQRLLGGTKDRLGQQIDGLDFEDPHFERKYQDLLARQEKVYDEIAGIEADIAGVQTRILNIQRQKISGDNVYQFLLYFDQLYDQFADAEKKEFIKSFIERVEIYPDRQENGQLLKRIDFRFPVFYNGEETKEISWDSETTPVTVCLLSKLHADQHIEVELNLDEMDLTTAESKATYEEIKEYVLENTGLKVNQLYIAQIKRKYGIIERANYNLPKSENTKVPNCPPDKEAAIVEALKHFGMIK